MRFLWKHGPRRPVDTLISERGGKGCYVPCYSWFLVSIEEQFLVSSNMGVPLTRVCLIASNSPRDRYTGYGSLFTRQRGPRHGIIGGCFSSLFVVLLMVLSTLTRSLRTFLIYVKSSVKIAGLLCYLTGGVMFRVANDWVLVYPAHVTRYGMKRGPYFTRGRVVLFVIFRGVGRQLGRKDVTRGAQGRGCVAGPSSV